MCSHVTLRSLSKFKANQVIEKHIRSWFRDRHKPRFTGLEILKYIGPGMLVTVGFIDPGNWAANVAAGAGFGYSLLWMVTLATLMLIVLQHNAAHPARLGAVMGEYVNSAWHNYVLGVISTVVVGLNMLLLWDTLLG
jgi:manganese transport protein